VRDNLRAEATSVDARLIAQEALRPSTVRLLRNATAGSALSIQVRFHSAFPKEGTEAVRDAREHATGRNDRRARDLICIPRVRTVSIERDPERTGVPFGAFPESGEQRTRPHA